MDKTKKKNLIILIIFILAGALIGGLIGGMTKYYEIATPYLDAKADYQEKSDEYKKLDEEFKNRYMEVNNIKEVATKPVKTEIQFAICGIEIAPGKYYVTPKNKKNDAGYGTSPKYEVIKNEYGKEVKGPNGEDIVTLEEGMKIEAGSVYIFTPVEE